MRITTLSLLPSQGFVNSKRVSLPNLKISERQLERLFRQQTGTTPKAWLRDQRMIYAKELFDRGMHKRLVSTITGFKSYSHFASEVSQYFGQQPKELEKAPVAVVS